MPTNSTKPSELIRAFNELSKTPAIPVCSDTDIPVTRSRFVVDHCLATHIARTKESFAFVPEQDPWQTYGIFRSAKEAWRHDKLPVLAVCAFSKSPVPFQKETGIQARTADQFLSDLQFAHRRVPTLGASPAYIIRHYHSPSDKYDDVILPAHANLIVYESHGLSHTQLTTLFDHVANVRGKIILCGDRSDFAKFHPELTKAVDRSISKAVPPELRHLVESSSPSAEELRNNVPNPIAFENTSPPIRNSEPQHAERPSLFELPSSRKPYLVYHAKPDNTAEFPDGYRVVAKIYAENIHSALADAQNFDAHWTENPGLQLLTHKMPRSTQPGDVIVHNGIARQFDGSGFKHIEFAVKQQPLPSLDRTPAIEVPGPEAPSPEAPRPKIAL